MQQRTGNAGELVARWMFRGWRLTAQTQPEVKTNDRFLQTADATGKFSPGNSEHSIPENDPLVQPGDASALPRA